MRSLCLLWVAVWMCSCVHPGAGAASPARPRVIAAAPTDAWWNGAVFYEVFVRSFKDSNGDGMGDLAGLIEKLDHLNDGNPETTDDLGVDALWLMPVFESPSYHGYDTTDFEAIERDYGTNADFDRLLAEAHRRGIKVVLDLMLNHTSNQHPWFVESSAAEGSKRRDWYVWSKVNPGWGQPWNEGQPSWHAATGGFYYGLFWGGMPDLNFRTAAVRDAMTQLALRWAKKGVDGFRLDAVRHLIETGPGKGQAGSEDNHVYLRELRAALSQANPQTVLVGEVMSNDRDIAPYFGNGSDELHMLFDFQLAEAIVGSVWSQDAQGLSKVISDGLTLFPQGSVPAPFLTNHDQTRVATALGGDGAKLGLAAAVLLTLPGAPFIYYGEELGMPNGPGTSDEFKRTPMLWTAEPGFGFSSHAPWFPVAPAQQVQSVAQQQGDAASLLSRYRRLIRARQASPSMKRGSIALIATGNPKVLAFFRAEGDEKVLVAHNLSSTPQAITVSCAEAGVEALFGDPGAQVQREGGAFALKLPPRGSTVYRLTK